MYQLEEKINNSIGEKNPFEGLCEIYLLYYDEVRGHIPILICPDDSIKNDEEKMRPIHFHSIWFLNKKEDADSVNIDLEYRDKIYFAKKFHVASKRIKGRAGLEADSPELIVIIIALPTEMNIFGSELINKMTEKIITNFESFLSQIIESEIAKAKIININIVNPQIKEIIKKGDNIKEDLRKLITQTCMEYFASVIKQKDPTSIKKQKAISFLSLKGIDIDYLVSNKDEITFSDIKLFNQIKKSNHLLNINSSLEISNVSFLKESNEVEVMVKNIKEKELNNILVKIAYIKDFFEREIFNHTIDCWFPKEDILFTLPIIPHENEYLFFTVENSHNEKHLSKKIDLENLTNRNNIDK